MHDDDMSSAQQDFMEFAKHMANQMEPAMEYTSTQNGVKVGDALGHMVLVLMYCGRWLDVENLPLAIYTRSHLDPGMYLAERGAAIVGTVAGIVEGSEATFPGVEAEMSRLSAVMEMAQVETAAEDLEFLASVALCFEAYQHVMHEDNGVTRDDFDRIALDEVLAATGGMGGKLK